MGCFGQNSHNSDLSTHILNVDLRSQLTLGNSLAGEGLASFDLKALVRDPKFTPAKLLPKAIFLENVVPCRVIGENGSGMTNRGLADRFDKGMIGGKGPDVSAPLGEGSGSGLHGNAASHGR